MRSRSTRPSLAALLAVAAGLVASAASTPSAGDGVSGSSDTFTVTLTEEEPTVTQRVTALLDAQVPIGEDGEINLNAAFNETDIAFVDVALFSETTGEESVTSVDTETQIDVSIGIAAFLGCDGLTPCEEQLVVEFTRLDGDATFDWDLDGFVSVLDADAELIGTLTFTPE